MRMYFSFLHARKLFPKVIFSEVLIFLKTFINLISGGVPKMKKSIIFFALFLILYTFQNSYSQFGNSRAILTGTSSGRTITANACDTIETGHAGVILCNLDGTPNTPFYCLDLCTGISISDTVKDSASTIPQAIYITNHYYPALTSYPGKMTSNNDEACAIQLAIWHFRNGLNTTDVTSISSNEANIKIRANQIIADVIANGGSETHVSTIIIQPGVDPDDFYIETKDTSGAPIAVSNIQLSITGGGTLSTYTVNTNASGISPNVTVSNAVGSSVIKASATLQIPGGITYSGVTGVKQLLVLGRTTTGIRTAEITWGALPVELSSFTSFVNNTDVTLNWSTASESNNSGFNIERKSANSTDWQTIGNVAGNGNSTVTKNYSYTDRNLSTGSYNYRLKQIDFNGNFEYFSLNNEVEIGTPVSYSLSQNYPNPFNPSTKISFDMAKDGNVSLKVFNNLGKEVATIVNGFRTAGYYTMEFNASNLTSGIYFYRMETNDFTKVMKMTLVK